MRAADVVALVCADLHLSLKPPVARSAEPDWLAAQARPLEQLRELQRVYGVPILYAGDIFDRWNPPVELVNWAIANLSFGYAVPGQHDLPNHRYEDVQRSGYWTLDRAQVIETLPPGQVRNIGEGGRALRLHGFPWGFPIQPPKEFGVLCLEIAVVHAYYWRRGCGYPGAPEESHAKSWINKCLGYDVVVFGDNHKPCGWLGKIAADTSTRETAFYNCGCLIPRKADERDHKPSVGLIHANGAVTRHYLDCSQDKWLDVPKGLPERADFAEVLEELRSLADSSVNFCEAVDRALERTDAHSKQIVLEAMDRLQDDLLGWLKSS